MLTAIIIVLGLLATIVGLQLKAISTPRRGY